MASRGDYKKVNQQTHDLKHSQHDRVDWYSLMPDNVNVFTFGRLAEDKYDGKIIVASVVAIVFNYGME